MGLIPDRLAFSCTHDVVTKCAGAATTTFSSYQVTSSRARDWLDSFFATLKTISV